MVLRPRTRQLRRAVVVAALGALIVPATAGAAPKKTPVITKVTPKTAYVGTKLTITGKHFKRGKAKNSVQFRRDGGKALFVKADVSTTKKLTVVIPANLEKYMVKMGGQPVASRFRVRVLSTKLGKSYTPLKRSPLIAPKAAAGPGPGAGGGTSTATGGGAGGSTGGGDAGGGTGGGPLPPPVPPALEPNDDCDKDGLLNAFELNVLKTLPCTADSDGDGVGDGFEYASAIDLNNDDYRNPSVALPHPGKRPYPNPLDASDASLDHDGDSLTLAQEFALWGYTVENGADPSLQSLTYSAGLKYSTHTRDGLGRRIPALVAATYSKQTDFQNWVTAAGYGEINLPDEDDVQFFDVNRNGLIDPARIGGQVRSESSYLDAHGVSGYLDPDGFLSDDERDEDADGLSNLDEFNMSMTSGWWKGMYPDEAPYVIPYAGTSAIDPDSDGDGVRDGADDQDHDDVPNFHEVSRNMINGRWNSKTDDILAQPTQDRARVNPFNPCLPFVESRTCPVTVPFENPWAPFNRPTANYFTFN